MVTRFVGRSFLILLTTVLAVTTVLAAAQNEAKAAQPAANLSLTLAKSVYGVGEEVEATVVLENVGTNGFYVPKYFEMPDLGFDVNIVSSGKPYCFVQASVACGKVKRRSVDRILQDDFFLLQPGGLIGLRLRLRTKCLGTPMPPLPPGTYEVVAEYSGSGGCLPDLRNKNTRFPVFQSRVKAVSAHLELIEK